LLETAATETPEHLAVADGDIRWTVSDLSRLADGEPGWSRRPARVGSRTPDRIVFRDELPVSSTGKVLRRELARELNSSFLSP